MASKQQPSEDTVRVRDASGREIEVDVKKALEQYRKIRTGSLRGATITAALVAYAKEQLGPNWEARITRMIEHEEDEEEREPSRQ